MPYAYHKDGKYQLADAIGDPKVRRYFAHYFFPTASENSYSSASLESLTPIYGNNFFRPCTFTFGYGTAEFDEFDDGGGVASMTHSLNHMAHADRTDPAKINYLKAGQWVNVILYWNVASSTTHEARIYINNQLTDTANPQVNIHPVDVLIKDYYGSRTGLRIGEPSIVKLVGGDFNTDDYNHNWTCDSTIDEFYVLKGTTSQTTASDIYAKMGRYYKPDPGSKESYFTSQNIQVFNQAKKSALSSSITNPLGAIDPASGAVADPKVTVLGASWTWYPEIVNTSGTPIINDYRIFTGPAPLNPRVEIDLLKNGVKEGLTHSQDGYSPAGFVLTSTDNLKYRVNIDISGIDVLNAVLLYSPVFDDITIYYTSGVQFLGYSYFD